MKEKTPKKKATKPKEKVVKAPKEEFLYHLTVELGGQKAEFNTNDLVQAFLGFPAPRFIKSKVSFTVSKGDRAFERTLFPKFARKVFISKNFAEGFARNINRFLN